MAIQIQRIKQRSAAVLASTALLTALTGAVGAGTAEAAAAGCWSSASTPNNSDLTTRSKGSYNLKTGIGSSCGNNGSLGKGTVFYVWCGEYNPDSNVLWFYGRIANTQTKGWTSEANLTRESGSWNLCNPR